MALKVKMGDEKRDGVYEGAVGVFSREPKGRGKLTVDGNIYEGYWDNGTLKGPGRYTHFGVDKKVVMTADFSPKAALINGVLNGPITFSYENNHYAYNYVNGKRDGLAKYTFENGDVFEILWEKGKCGEKAKLIKKSGETYEGNWMPTDPNSKADFEAHLGHIMVFKVEIIEEFIPIEGSPYHKIHYLTGITEIPL